MKTIYVHPSEEYPVYVISDVGEQIVLSDTEWTFVSDAIAEYRSAQRFLKERHEVAMKERWAREREERRKP